MDESLNIAAQWKELFTHWPENIPCRGIVTNNLNETTPFKGYMIKGEILLLERANPDASGGRFILLPFATINSVKLTDPIKESDAKGAGFAGKFAK